MNFKVLSWSILDFSFLINPSPNAEIIISKDDIDFIQENGLCAIDYD